MEYRARWLTVAVSALLSPLSAEAGDIDFARDVRPVLQKHCFRCHGEKKQEGGLRLDLRRRALAGGDTAAAIVPGKTGGELLRRVASSDEKLAMPPGKPLADAEVATLRAWVEQGAKWPDELAGKEPAAEHWAFRPLRRPSVPEIPNPKSQIRNEIDRFVLAKLSDNGLSLSPPADRRTLVRRLYLDLVGLPPSPEEVKRFLDDSSADAYEKVVDRLLASPHFGERWGRHWLDLARFAESDGYENDAIRHDAWRFRDWVIKAVNDDVPFDQFSIEQLAGDLLVKAEGGGRKGDKINDPDSALRPPPSALIAAGFHRNTLWNSAASGDKEEFRTYAVKDRADTTAMVWIGLTAGCAQCHSHKYDPISHREYYQLYAFFNRTDNAEVKLADGKSAPTLKEVNRETRVHLRGNFLRPGPVVAPGVPAFLPPLKPRGETADRLDLARWLFDPAHPLTARVAANRIWQHLFGAGLVPTPENFGTNGTPPRHPELLDWLATEFVRRKWSRKSLIRVIVLSETYRQSSQRPAEAGGDANNQLLGRQNRFRVEAEIVRDLSLSTSGLLNPKLGGPSIVPPFPDGLLDQKFTNEALKMPGGDRHRRGVYIHAQRTLPHPTLQVFDGADGNSPCPRRDRSVTPLQALTLLNDPVFVECAKALGERVRKSAVSDDDRLRFAFELCLARPPSDRERAVLTKLVKRQRELGAKDDAVWLGVARTLLNLEEFTTRE